MAYEIAATSRRCARTGRELQPGEKFFSVLYDREGHLLREDVSLQAWQGAPLDAFSFWQGKVPAQELPRRMQLDQELLFDFFMRFADEAEPRKIKFRYIIALLLMRQRRLRFEEVSRQGDRETLLLRCAKTKKVYPVVNPQSSETELAEVEEEVRKVILDS